MDKCHTSEPDAGKVPVDRPIAEIPGVPLEPILRSHGWVYLAPMEKTADGFQLWSETYDRKLDDVFAVQGEIAHSVAAPSA